MAERAPLRRGFFCPLKNSLGLILCLGFAAPSFIAAAKGLELGPDPFQIPLRGRHVLFQLAQPGLQHERGSAATFQPVTDAPRLVIELRQGREQRTLLGL